MSIQQSITTIENSSIGYGLWSNSPASNVKINNLTLRDLSLSWLRFSYQGEVIESNSIESILQQAMEKDCRACFIQTPGNIISEDWILPHWKQDDLHACVQEHLKKDDFLICADIIKTEQYFALDTSCFLINLQQYKKMGYPKFGFASQKKLHLIQPQVSSRETDISRREITQLKPLPNISTNLGLAQSNDKGSNKNRGSNIVDSSKRITPSGVGWGFIDASLRHGLTVSQLPENISNKQLLLPAIELCHSLRKTTAASLPLDIEPVQKRFLNGVEAQITRGRSGVFLWNIESYDDLPNSNQSNTPANDPLCDLYSVAAGFKPNMLLHRHGFESTTKVTFFDYSQQALDIRKLILDEWDGSDYPAFCQKLMRRFPTDETFYQLWNGVRPERIDWTDAELLWANELRHWGGAEKFKQQWQLQQRLNHQFIHCDLIHDPESILAQIKDSSVSVIWWSNAFFTISSNWLLSIEQRRQRFKYWIEELAKRAPGCWIYGADHNNRPVNNINVSQYLNELNLACENDEQDELTAPGRNALPLRF